MVSSWKIVVGREWAVLIYSLHILAINISYIKDPR
jgi:hypothetical protein